jgi:quercetin dioxygenase-like cupin family protein
MTDTVTKSREFMTTWHTSPRPGIEAWSTRNKANLMGSGRSTDYVPLFRPFDLLALPNQSRIILQNSDHRIGVESVCGAQPFFRRHIDFDTVYFQFAGTATIETEYGEYVMRPGDLMHVPEGISHRATGTADSLRWFAFVNDPFIAFMDESEHTGESEFRMIRHNGPNWTIPAGQEQPKKSGIVEERMVTWDHGPDDMTVVERDYGYLVDASSTHISEKRSAIRVMRGFDVFKAIAGKKGAVEPIFQSPHLEIKTYNITGEQFAFHRALRSEEIRIQFRGEAEDMSELANQTCRPGDATVIPRGIAHSVITEPPDSPLFLRLNFYSNIPWHYPTDLTRHFFNSTFEPQTIIRREAPWRIEAGLVVPSLANA